MFNPFPRFTLQAWAAHSSIAFPYLISQTFFRGFPSYRKSNPTCLLLTPHDSYCSAWEHYQKMSTDPLAALLRLDHNKHWEAIERLLQPGSDYIVYSGTIPHEQTLFRRLGEAWQPFFERYTRNMGQPATPPALFQLRLRLGELVVEVTQSKQSYYIPLTYIEKEYELPGI